MGVNISSVEKSSYFVISQNLLFDVKNRLSQNLKCDIKKPGLFYDIKNFFWHIKNSNL